MFTTTTIKKGETECNTAKHGEEKKKIIIKVVEIHIWDDKTPVK